MTNLETELLNTWNAEVAKLTPDERKRLAAATPDDWATAIAEIFTDPRFWQVLGVALLEGIADGIGDYMDGR